MKAKVSVVVPIYNVSAYLKECLDSLLSQTLNCLEIILIDDGSTDGSGDIVDKYASLDKRIVAIHQNNSGYSSAVNKGIELATGEYIGIVESDDFVEPDMFEKLFLAASSNKADIAKGMFYIYDSTKKPKNKIFRNPCGVDLSLAPDSVFSPKDWPQIIAFHSSIWSSIYRADLIKKIKVPETTGASYQDLPFMTLLMVKASKVIVVKKPFVHWRNEPNQSHSTSNNGEKALLMAKNTLLSLEILQKSGKYKYLKEGFFAQAIWTNSSFFFHIKWRLKNEYFSLLRKVFLPIKNDPTFKGIFLRPEDKLMIKILEKNYGSKVLYLAYIFGSLRRKITR